MYHNVGRYYRGKDGHTYQERECPRCHAKGNKDVKANFSGSEHIEYHCKKCRLTWRDLA